MSQLYQRAIKTCCSASAAGPLSKLICSLQLQITNLFTHQSLHQNYIAAETQKEQAQLAAAQKRSLLQRENASLVRVAIVET